MLDTIALISALNVFTRLGNEAPRRWISDPYGFDFLRPLTCLYVANHGDQVMADNTANAAFTKIEGVTWLQSWLPHFNYEYPIGT